MPSSERTVRTIPHLAHALGFANEVKYLLCLHKLLLFPCAATLGGELCDRF